MNHDTYLILLLDLLDVIRKILARKKASQVVWDDDPLGDLGAEFATVPVREVFALVFEAF